MTDKEFEMLMMATIVFWIVVGLFLKKISK